MMEKFDFKKPRQQKWPIDIIKEAISIFNQNLSILVKNTYGVLNN